MGQDLENTLFRIIQESVVNAVEHGKADKVRINLVEKQGWVELEIEDDGKGFEVKEVLSQKEESSRIGLIGIRERVTLLEGEIQIQSSPGDGTKISVTIPTRGGRLV